MLLQRDAEPVEAVRKRHSRRGADGICGVLLREAQLDQLLPHLADSADACLRQLGRGAIPRLEHLQDLILCVSRHLHIVGLLGRATCAQLCGHAGLLKTIAGKWTHACGPWVARATDMIPAGPCTQELSVRASFSVCARTPYRSSSASPFPSAGLAQKTKMKLNPISQRMSTIEVWRQPTTHSAQA